MTRTLPLPLAAMLLATTPLLAQPAPQPPVAVDAKVAALRDAALSDD